MREQCDVISVVTLHLRGPMGQCNVNCAPLAF